MEETSIESEGPKWLTLGPTYSKCLGVNVFSPEANLIPLVTEMKSVLPVSKIIGFEPSFFTRTEMNKKYAILVIILVSTLGTSACYCWLWNQSLTFHFPDYKLFVRNIGWNIPLARAEFNISYYQCPPPEKELTIHHVKVNGSKVDVYPEYPSIKNGGSIVVRVYFRYDYNTTYEFKFITEREYIYKIVLTSPSPRALDDEKLNLLLTMPFLLPERQILLRLQLL